MTDDLLHEYSVEAFERGEIDVDHFNHEAHVYMGWLYLEEFDVTESIARISAALERITLQLGVPDKYHATITWFFMLIIAERRAFAVSKDWNSFRRDNNDLFRRDNNVLNRYYNKDTLTSSAARKRFVLPDRLAA